MKSQPKFGVISNGDNFKRVAERVFYANENEVFQISFSIGNNPKKTCRENVFFELNKESFYTIKDYISQILFLIEDERNYKLAKSNYNFTILIECENFSEIISFFTTKKFAKELLKAICRIKKYNGANNLEFKKRQALGIKFQPSPIPFLKFLQIHKLLLNCA